MKPIHRFVQLALLPAALTLSGAALAQSVQTATPITNVIVLFDENISFDHYFGTYPNAQNNPGDQIFVSYPGTPTVNGYDIELLFHNPNLNATGTAKVNPTRLSAAQAYTCSNNHNYGPEQQAVDGGLLDQFPKYTGKTTSEGCASDGSTVMAYYDGNTVAALWNYAQNYALNDNSFGSTFGPSSTGAINLVSGNTYGGQTFFGTGSTASYPNTVTGSSSVVTDIGDFDPYLDDCGADSGGTVTTTTTLQMTGTNIGDLLNAAGVTWGWFQGGFRPTTAYSGTTPAVCGAQRIEHEYPSVNPTVVVPQPAAPLETGSNIHVETADYVPHHEPFQFYASTRNPHHLAPSSPAMIGQSDQANHQYDTQDFFTALANGNLPAVSFIKPPAAYNAHPGNSDPVTEQYWITQVINQVMQSPYWPTTAIIIAYDDSDGWYDHVTAPIVSPSDVTESGESSVYDNLAGVGNCGTPVSGAQLARCGHGPRLPLLVISPYANPNFVDHTFTNQASIINFIEYNWNLGYIDGATAPAAGTGSFDRYSGTLLSMFNFSAGPNTAPLLLTCSGAYASGPATMCPLDPTP
ncbi:MAG TPA: alkaline phosphatase family protein [Steroidobacteraceae bacterium]|nr:alkaline phosphatase family protein [Steroidobacteraceae bacterium]